VVPEQETPNTRSMGPIHPGSTGERTCTRGTGAPLPSTAESTSPACPDPPTPATSRARGRPSSATRRTPTSSARRAEERT
jgi:hypothetical protein